MEKLLEFIKTFIGQFIAVFQDYQEQAPISPEKRKERKAAIVTAGVFFVPTALILLMFREPLGALFRVLILMAPICIVFFLLAKSADMMDKAEPQHPVIFYPVFRGFQPGSNYCQAAIVDEEFKEIADFFDSCYFDHFVDRVNWNCVIYIFRIRPKRICQSLMSYLILFSTFVRRRHPCFSQRMDFIGSIQMLSPAIWGITFYRSHLLTIPRAKRKL